MVGGKKELGVEERLEEIERAVNLLNANSCRYPNTCLDVARAVEDLQEEIELMREGQRHSLRMVLWLIAASFVFAMLIGAFFVAHLLHHTPPIF
jgi:hypothetical protein